MFPVRPHSFRRRTKSATESHLGGPGKQVQHCRDSVATLVDSCAQHTRLVALASHAMRRVKSNYIFRNKGTDSVSVSSIKWMDIRVKRVYNRILATRFATFALTNGTTSLSAATTKRLSAASRADRIDRRLQACTCWPAGTRSASATPSRCLGCLPHGSLLFQTTLHVLSCPLVVVVVVVAAGDQPAVAVIATIISMCIMPVGMLLASSIRSGRPSKHTLHRVDLNRGQSSGH
jgi:hypothetical protein